MKRASNEFMRTVVADSERIGVDAAARKHGVAPRTVDRYRARLGAGRTTRPRERVALDDRDKSEAIVEMKAKYRDALDVLLAKILVLVEKSNNLFHVAGAFKIVHEAWATAEMLDLASPEASPSESPTPNALVSAQRSALGLLDRSTVVPIRRAPDDTPKGA